MTHNVVPETVVNQPGIPDVEPAPAFAGVDIRRCTPPGVASPASSLMPAVLALHQTRQPAQIWPLEPFTMHSCTRSMPSVHRATSITS